MLILKFEQYVAPGSPNENFTIVVKQSKNTNFHPDTGLPFFIGQTIFVPNGDAGPDAHQENKITSIVYDTTTKQ